MVYPQSIHSRQLVRELCNHLADGLPQSWDDLTGVSISTIRAWCGGRSWYYRKSYL